jgi:hypothetical protein
MNPIHAIRRAAGILAWLAGVLLAFAAAAPAALASGPGPLPPATPQPIRWFPPGWNKHPPLPGPAHAHTAVTGGMPGWQIALIAIGAALAAATVALLVHRARAGRRKPVTPAASTTPGRPQRAAPTPARPVR